MRTNQDYKNDALRALKGNWAPAVLAAIVLLAIGMVLSGPYAVPYTKLIIDNPQISSMSASNPEAYLAAMAPVMRGWGIMIVSFFLLFYPLSVGYYNAHKKLLVEGDNRLTSNMFSIAFSNYLHKFWGMLLMYIFIMLWSLLFVIPGIIKTFSYAMTPYILEENPELSANQAIDRSRAMMKGHKFDLFYLWLSFIGWGILCMFTFGIGFIWLMPYIQTANASFYEDVKAEYGTGFDAEIRDAAGR